MKPNPAAPVDLARWSEPLPSSTFFVGGEDYILVPPAVLATLVAVARAARRYMNEVELVPQMDCEPGCVGCALCEALEAIIDTAGPGGSG